MKNYNELYNDHFNHVVNHIKGRAGLSHNNAEDLAQEVFIKIYQKWDFYDPEKSKITTWLINITNNTLIDNHRKRKLHTVAMSNFVDDDGTMFIHPVAKGNPSSKMINNENINILKWYISQLSKPVCEVATMHFIEQLEYNEIADILDIPYNTVKVRLMRARKILKSKLSQLNFA